MITKEQYEKAVKDRESAEKIISEFHEQKRIAFKQRMKENPIFTEDELIFSATIRCKGCGAGLAYPKDCGPGHYWDCSGVLLGKIKNPGKEHEQYPFMYHEIKSEDQPSAHGHSTREKK